MTHQTKTLYQINNEAIKLLYKELGIVSTLRFIRQFTNGFGNYTEERGEIFVDKSLEDILLEIKNKNKNE